MQVQAEGGQEQDFSGGNQQTLKNHRKKNPDETTHIARQLERNCRRRRCLWKILEKEKWCGLGIFIKRLPARIHHCHMEGKKARTEKTGKTWMENTTRGLTNMENSPQQGQTQNATKVFCPISIINKLKEEREKERKDFYENF